MTFSCRVTLRRPVSVLALLAALVVPAAAEVAAAPEAAAANRAPVTGRDISWPNCPKGMGIPSRRSEGQPMPPRTTGFVVIGLTNGPGFYPNPCLGSQVAWARKHHRLTGMYAMTTYPTAAQVTKHGGAGPYRGTDRLTRLRNTGHAQATFNVKNARAAGLRNTFVWVDIEEYPVAPWRGSLKERRAVIDGVLRGYKDAGVRVGIYSIASSWTRITGSWRPGLPLWDSVGPTSQRKATARCSTTSFTGGRRVMTQWWDDHHDFDVTCPGITGTTATPSPLAKYRGTTLKEGSRGAAVKAMQKVVKATPDGIFGPQTKAKVKAFQKAHRLKQTGVVREAEWRAMGAWTTTPGRKSTMSRYFRQY